MTVALPEPRQDLPAPPRARAPRFWQAREEPAWRRLALAPLALLAALFGVVVRLRRAWYRQPGRARRVGARVISVGNLTIGGAGKTPVTVALATRLQRAGARPVVLSRGYGRVETSPVVVSDGERVLANAAQAGDEPLLIARSCPGVPVMVGADRAALAADAVRRFGRCTILLDDGLQHLRLHRDRDVVVVDASDPFGNERLLPRGPLREPVETLRQASLVWLSRVDEADPERVEALAARVWALTGREPVRSGYRIADVIGLDGGQSFGADALAGRRVLAVSGIARPESFMRTLRAGGAEVVGQCVFADHHAFAGKEIEAVWQQAARLGADFVAVTEKDAMRLESALCRSVGARRGSGPLPAGAVAASTTENDRGEGWGGASRKRAESCGPLPVGAVEASTTENDRGEGWGGASRKRAESSGPLPAGAAAASTTENDRGEGWGGASRKRAQPFRSFIAWARGKPLPRSRRGADSARMERPRARTMPEPDVGKKSLVSDRSRNQAAPPQPSPRSTTVMESDTAPAGRGPDPKRSSERPCPDTGEPFRVVRVEVAIVAGAEQVDALIEEAR